MHGIHTSPFLLLRKLALAACVLLSLSACRKELDTVPEHLEFVFPLNEGLTRIYAVRDTNFATTQTMPEGRNYFIKEVTGGIETDLLGRELTVLDTWTSPDSTDSAGTRFYDWTFAIRWSLYKDDQYAERIEGTTRFLIMKQPPVEGTRWNGNLYNSLNTQVYEVRNHDTTVTVQGVTYEHCVFVVKEPFSVTDPINPFIYTRAYAYEIYAPDVGLIVRHDEDIEVQGDVSQGYDPVPESVYLHQELTTYY